MTELMTGRITVRPIDAGDRSALEVMAARCTRRSLHQRFHAPLTAIPANYVDALTDGSADVIAVGAFVGDAIVGVASLHPVGPTVAEIGVLVEDAWQQQGVGRCLVDRLVSAAHARHLDSVQAQVLTSHARVAGLLRPHGSVAVREQGITSDLLLTLRRSA
jgi:RimJ/RimL family protein N-acetyltransferase